MLIGREHWLDSRPWIDRADANVDAYVSTHYDNTGYDLHAKLVEWRERGIVFFRNVISHDLIDRYLEDLECLKNNHYDYDISVELAGSTKKIDKYKRHELDYSSVKFNNVHTVSKAACGLSLAREVSEFIGHAFNSPACVLQSLTFTKGSQQPIHIDYPYVRSQTMIAHLAASWIPLEDISPDSGPLAYYPGSHKNEACGFFDWGNGSILLEEDSTQTPMEFANFLWHQMEAAGLKPEIFCPKKGDVLIWHGRLAHEGTKINDDALTRNSYVTHYTSLKAYPEAHMRPGAMERGEYFSENGGYVFEHPWMHNPKKLPSWSLESENSVRGPRRWMWFR